jgi:signal transduction histidine kinase
MGLEIMKERVSHLRGNLQMDSQPGKGTTLLIRIPLEPAHGT